MKMSRLKALFALSLVVVLGLATVIARAADLLPSWNDGQEKQSTISFVEKGTTPDSPDFAPAPERNALPSSTTTTRANMPTIALIISPNLTKVSTKPSHRAGPSSV